MQAVVYVAKNDTLNMTNYILLLFLITTAWANEKCVYEQSNIKCDNPPYNVTSIQISHSKIPEINRQLFSQFKNVKHINVFSSELEKIDVDTFADMTLDSLDLSYNRIKILKKGIFPDFIGINSIRFAFNNIDTIEDQTFYRIDYINRLDLEGNRLKRINANTFLGLSRLEYLNLSVNSLESLDAKAFNETYYLADLDLSGNCLSVLPENLFFRHYLLERLFLSFNQIRILPDNIFRGMRDLKELDLSHNQIVYLPDSIFYKINKLEILQLHNNNLFQLNTDVLVVFQPKLTEISLHNNLWKCEVLDKIEEKLKSHKIQIAANPPKDQRCFTIIHD